MENEYISPTLDAVGETPETRGFIAIAGVAILAAFVYEGAVLVNYVAGINVGGGVNVGAWVNAIWG